jgi:protein transport protein SEC24
LIFFA